ncbi:MAG: helix-turn-helix domain-containing protein [Solirubrobacteraceae bacterium]
MQRRPGLTVKDAGAEFGVDPTSLYRIVKQLESDGKLEKRGRELHPA